MNMEFIANIFSKNIDKFLNTKIIKKIIKNILKDSLEFFGSKSISITYLKKILDSTVPVGLIR